MARLLAPVTMTTGEEARENVRHFMGGSLWSSKSKRRDVLVEVPRTGNNPDVEGSEELEQSRGQV